MISFWLAKKAQFTAWRDNRRARDIVTDNARKRAKDLALLRNSEEIMVNDPEQQRKQALWEQKHLPYGM